MPTVILLDVSLSMSRPVPTSDSSDTQTRLTIAIAAINSFLDYLTLHAKLEYVALVTYSSGYELAVPFTRDFDSIRTKLTQLEEGDKTCIEVALHGVNQIVLNEWGYQISVQMILITDGNIGVGAIGRNRIIQALPLPPTYPAKIHVLPIAFPNDPSLQHAMPMYQKLVDLATVSSSDIPDGMGRGAIYCPDQLTVPSIITTMNRLCEQQYQEFWCSLKCGQLEARVQLFPAPQPACLDVGASLAETIQVVGFLSQQDMGTPIAISKHLVIPQAQSNNTAANRENYGSKTPTKEGSSTDGSATEDDMSDPSKIPNFCVLLHGALKVEGMSAIVQLGPDWWGSVSAWCEAARARRSCLLLSVLRPGAGAAPWLGPLSQLGPADDAASGTPVESFPVRAWRSYTGGGGGSAWARPHALLADVQKVLRHARKLPDKTQHLYKELNRLRRAAISLGFSELLTCVGSALERECAQLPSTAPSECALQLAHAAAALRDPRTVLDIKHTLQPLPTSFTVTSMSH